MSEIDIHTVFAADLFGVTHKVVTSEQRTAAKRALHFLAMSGAPEQMAAEIAVPVERFTAAWKRIEWSCRQGTFWIPLHEQGPEYWCPNCGAILNGPGRCC